MRPPLPAALLAVAAGGAVGSACRYLVSLAVLRYLPHGGPAATLLVNATGCLLIGLLMPLAERGSLPPLAALLLTTGLLGGLTTFSTFGHETVLLGLVRGRLDWALLNVVASLAMGLGAVWLGRAMTTAIVR